MKTGRTRISKDEYDRLGGMANPRLFRVQRGSWQYYSSWY